MASASAPDSSPASLQDCLSAALPAGFACNIRYVQSPAKQCDPLFSAPPGYSPERTRLASHFLTLSVNPATIEQDSKAVPAGGNDVLSFAIEVLIYSTKRLTTLFVSKVDSTSYIPRRRPSPIQTTVTSFLRWLADNEQRQHPRRTVVISLFARAQAQYLFPGSSDNKAKHVLDDRQLIKWWARVIDPIITSPSPSSQASCQGYMTVPGYAGNELRRSFMPTSSLSPSKPAWLPGHPLTSLATTRHIPVDAPPRYLLPRFPDDPKARFIQDLDDEIGISQQDSQPTSSSSLSSPSKRGNGTKAAGKWKSIHDVDRFWEAMEFRQECSSGRVVGFLWVVISPPEAKNGIDAESQESAAIPPSPTPTPASPPSLQREPSNQRRKKPLTGPIIPRQPRLKSGSSSNVSKLSAMSASAATSNGGTMVPEELYDKAMQTLLASDFSSLAAAVRSTSRWIAEMKSGVEAGQDVVMKVEGKKVVEESAGENSSSAVNDLGGMIVRKKRKVEGGPGTEQGNGEVKKAEEPAAEKVNVLGASMVRKKAKKV